MFLDRGDHGNDMRHRVQHDRTDRKLHILSGQHRNNDNGAAAACLSGGDLLQHESRQEVGSSGSSGRANKSQEEETGDWYLKMFAILNSNILSSSMISASYNPGRRLISCKILRRVHRG